VALAALLEVELRLVAGTAALAHLLQQAVVVAQIGTAVTAKRAGQAVAEAKVAPASAVLEIHQPLLRHKVTRVAHKLAVLAVTKQVAEVVALGIGATMEIHLEVETAVQV
jgi:hypothetical protein